MRKLLSGKMMLVVCLLAWVCIVRLLTGCSVARESQEKVRDLEFTVVGENELPQELKALAEEKKAAPFKLSYSNDQGLFIVVGYGEQSTGGYSITVNDLYLTENAIYVDTTLLGPQPGEGTGKKDTPSYPYIVLKTEFLDKPVVFN